MSGATGLFDGDRTLDHLAEDPRLTLGTMLAEDDEASLRLVGDARLYLRSPGGAERLHAYDWARRGYRGDSVHAQIAHIVQHLLDGAPLVNSGREYLRNLAVVEAAYRSAAEGRCVVI